MQSQTPEISPKHRKTDEISTIAANQSRLTLSSSSNDIPIVSRGLILRPQCHRYFPFLGTRKPAIVSQLIKVYLNRNVVGNKMTCRHLQRPLRCYT